MGRRFVLAVDDFYRDPDAVRRQALGLEFSEPDEYTGWRTRPLFPRGVRSRVESVLRLPITRFSESDDRQNYLRGHGVFYFGLSKGPRAEAPGVHFDSPLDWVTMIVYLTPDAPHDAGTSLWQHRATGLASAPARRDAARFGKPVGELNAMLLRDGHDKSKWNELDRLGNVYNRAVFYRSGILHSATRHFGSSPATGRLYQTFRFAVDWRGLARN